MLRDPDTSDSESKKGELSCEGGSESFSSRNASNFWGVKLSRARSGKGQRQSVEVEISEGPGPVQASTPIRKRSRASLDTEAEETVEEEAKIAVALDAGKEAERPKRIFVRKTYTVTEMVEIMGSGQPPQVVGRLAHERCDVFHSSTGPVGEAHATFISRIDTMSPQFTALTGLLADLKDTQSNAVIERLSGADGIAALFHEAGDGGAIDTGEEQKTESSVDDVLKDEGVQGGEALFPVKPTEPTPLLSQWMM